VDSAFGTFHSDKQPENLCTLFHTQKKSIIVIGYRQTWFMHQNQDCWLRTYSRVSTGPFGHAVSMSLPISLPSLVPQQGAHVVLISVVLLQASEVHCVQSIVVLRWGSQLVCWLALRCANKNFTGWTCHLHYTGIS